MKDPFEGIPPCPQHKHYQIGCKECDDECDAVEDRLMDIEILEEGN